MIPIIKRELVDRRGWLDEEEFLNCLAITQSAPGPLAVNTAAFAGFRIAGLPGVAVGVLGTVIPSYICILLIARLLGDVSSLPSVRAAFSGLRPAIVAVILAAGFRLGRRTLRDPVSWLMFSAALSLLLLTGLNPVAVLILAGAAGLIIRLPALVSARDGRQGGC